MKSHTGVPEYIARGLNVKLQKARNNAFLNSTAGPSSPPQGHRRGATWVCGLLTSPTFPCSFSAAALGDSTTPFCDCQPWEGPESGNWDSTLRSSWLIIKPRDSEGTGEKQETMDTFLARSFASLLKISNTSTVPVKLCTENIAAVWHSRSSYGSMERERINGREKVREPCEYNSHGKISNPSS